MATALPPSGILLLAAACLGLSPAARASAQEYDRPPWQGGFVRSLGRPPIWHPHLSAMFGFYGTGDDRVATGYGAFGVRKALGNPINGLLSAVGEGWLGYRNVDVEGGGRAFLFSPFFRIGAGLDYDARNAAFDPLFTWSTPWRRGGVLGTGTTIRIDYLPSREGSFAFGLTVPLFNANAGRTRPFADRVSLAAPRPTRLVPDTLDPALLQSLAQLRSLARRINLLTTPFIDQRPQDPERAMRGTVQELQRIFATGAAADATTGGVEAEVRAFHAEMSRAFAIAGGGSATPTPAVAAAGEEIARIARARLLNHVLMPYNRLLGRRKGNDRLDRFRAVAWSGFVRDLGRVEPESARWQQIMYVYQSLLDIAEENRALARARWGDDRLVWLPLQYGLLPEEHDSQEKLDALVGRAVGREFTDGNRVSYVLNEQFQTEVARSIEEARDYHVLWLHDFRGREGSGRADRVAFNQVVTYLRALTRGVREYDRVGRLPVYLILLDQLYYEVNRTRPWFRLLERPLHERVQVPGDPGDMSPAIAALQDSLREALRGSELLRLEARQFGQAWVDNLIRVHVNVTNPTDYTFNSAQVVPILGIPDNLMRDHRKILFYDVTEDDPYRGLVLYTGMGVGEHYAGATWEDRAIMIQGPAALSVKQAARQVFQVHGFGESEIPWPLRPRPRPPDYDRRVREAMAADQALSARVMEVHNGTGYAQKDVDVAKATLYTLAPRGSVIKVPDSLWGSQLFGGMLLGAALRGARVLVMAPSLASAPSAGWAPMARAYELLARLLVLERVLEPEIREAGGLLKVGIYDPKSPVGDLADRFAVFGPERPQEEWFRELFAFAPQVEAVGAALDSVLSALAFAPSYLVRGIVLGDSLSQPKLHLKGHFIASAEAWRAVVEEAGLAGVLAEYITVRARALEHRPQEAYEPRTSSERLIREMDRVYAAGLARQPPARRDQALLYLTMGSPNQDYRSLMLDGEAMGIVSGSAALVGFFDFVVIAGLCRWVESPEELQTLLPEPGNVRRLLARWIKTLL